MPIATPTEQPRVTVFIPTWNGGELFEEVLQGIVSQETDFPFEILAIDSGSKDGTLERLRRFPIRVLEIPNREFNHGLTRNRAISEARGEIVVLTVQDATPASSRWLATMVSDFEDPQVAGVYTNQLPRPDCNPFLRIRLRNWVQAGTTPIARQIPSAEEFWAKHPRDRFMAIAFDNVSSAVRRSIALELPFVKRAFGEDVTWAKGAILAGYKIVMEPRVSVIHSHDNSILYEFRRVYMDHQNLNDLVGLHTVPTLRLVFQFSAHYTTMLFTSLWRDEKQLPLGTRLLWSLKVIPYAFTQNLAQYLGVQSNRQGHRGIWKYLDRIMGYHV
jgi:rhamnosyltransferase